MRLLLGMLLALGCFNAVADSFVYAEREADYRVALDELSVAIMDQGFTLVKIQPVDKGLHSKGYEVNEGYKLIFFSNKDMEAKALKIAPEMATLLPLKVILYQEEGKVVAGAYVLDSWRQVFDSEAAQEWIRHADRDVRSILKQYGKQVRSR